MGRRDNLDGEIERLLNELSWYSNYEPGPVRAARIVNVFADFLEAAEAELTEDSHTPFAPITSSYSDLAPEMRAIARDIHSLARGEKASFFPTPQKGTPSKAMRSDESIYVYQLSYSAYILFMRAGLTNTQATSRVGERLNSQGWEESSNPQKRYDRFLHESWLEGERYREFKAEAEADTSLFIDIIGEPVSNSDLLKLADDFLRKIPPADKSIK